MLNKKLTEKASKYMIIWSITFLSSETGNYITPVPTYSAAVRLTCSSVSAENWHIVYSRAKVICRSLSNILSSRPTVSAKCCAVSAPVWERNLHFLTSSYDIFPAVVPTSTHLVTVFASMRYINHCSSYLLTYLVVRLEDERYTDLMPSMGLLSCNGTSQTGQVWLDSRYLTIHDRQTTQFTHRHNTATIHCISNLFIHTCTTSARIAAATVDNKHYTTEVLLLRRFHKHV